MHFELYLPYQIPPIEIYLPTFFNALFNLRFLETVNRPKEQYSLILQGEKRTAGQ